MSALSAHITTLRRPLAAEARAGFARLVAQHTSTPSGMNIPSSARPRLALPDRLNDLRRAAAVRRRQDDLARQMHYTALLGHPPPGGGG